MKFGDGLTMFQLTTALNLAYFTFSELRAPASRQLDKAIASTKKRIASAKASLNTIQDNPKARNFDLCNLFLEAGGILSTLELYDDNSNLYSEFAYAENILQYDEILRLTAIICAIGGFFAVYFSSIYAAATLPFWAFNGLTAVFALPVLLSIAYNWVIASMLKDDRKRVENISSKVDAIAQDFRTRLYPRFLELQEEAKADRH